MATSLIKSIFSLIIPSFAGYTVISFIFRSGRVNFPSKLALSYGMGMGLLSQIMLLMGVIGVPYSGISVSAALILLSIFMLFLKKHFMKYTKKDNYNRDLFPNLSTTLGAVKNLPISHKFLCLLAFLYVSYSSFYILWRAFNLPVYSYDAIVIIATKAKVLFFERVLSPIANTHHPFYPLHVPFSTAWVAIATGEWDGQNIRIIFPFYFFSLLAIYIDTLRKHVSVFWTAAGIILLCSSDFLLYHATICYRDLTLLYYNFAVITILFHWRKNQDNSYLLAAGLFAGFGTFTKLEGSIFLFIYLALITISYAGKGIIPLRAKISGYIRFSVPSFGMLIFYSAYRWCAGIPPPADKSGFYFGPVLIERLFPLVTALWNDLFLLGPWNMVWFLFLVSVCVNFEKSLKNRHAVFFLAAIVLFLLAYFSLGLFTSSFRYIGGISSTAAISRLVLHFFPLVPLSIAFLNSPVKAPADMS